MSEQAPKSVPEAPKTAAELLADFDENKANTAYKKAFIGKSGISNFEPEDRQRLKDVEAYEAHQARTHEFAKLDDDARAEAELNARINDDPRLRQADMIARNIVEARNNGSEERVKELEDRLNELLIKYESSDDYDSFLTDVIINRTAGEASSVDKDSSEKAEDPKTADADKAPVDKNDLLAQTSDILKSVENMTLKDILTNGKSDQENAKLIGDLQAALAKIQSELVGHEEETKKAKTLKNYGGGITGLRDAEKDAHFVEDPEKAHDMANATLLRPEEAKAHQDGKANFIPNMDVAHADAIAEGKRIHDPAEAEAAAYKQQVLKNLAATRAENEPKKKSTLGEKYLLWKYGDGSEKSEKEKSRRKKIFFAIGAAAVVGAAGIATFFAMKNGADHSTIAPGLDKHVGGGHEFIEPTPKAHHNVTELPTEHFTHDQLTVDPGEGWIHQLLDGDPTLTNNEIYNHILPELLKSKNAEVQKWVMELTNAQGNIEPGISRPGQMPEAVMREALSYKNR